MNLIDELKDSSSPFCTPQQLAAAIEFISQAVTVACSNDWATQSELSRRFGITIAHVRTVLQRAACENAVRIDASKGWVRYSVTDFNKYLPTVRYHPRSARRKLSPR